MRERDRVSECDCGQNCCILQAAGLGRQRCCGLLSESEHNMHVLSMGSIRHCGSRESKRLAGESMRAQKHAAQPHHYAHSSVISVTWECTQIQMRACTLHGGDVHFEDAAVGTLQAQ